MHTLIFLTSKGICVWAKGCQTKEQILRTEYPNAAYDLGYKLELKKEARRMQEQFKQLCKMTALCTLLMTTLSFGVLLGGNQVMAYNRNDAACKTMEQLYNNPQQRIIANDKELNSIMQDKGTFMLKKHQVDFFLYY